MFIFIQFGTPNAEGVVFLPDYNPTLDIKNNKLILTPIEHGKTTIIFSSHSQSILTNWYQFTVNSQESLRSLHNILSTSSLSYEEDIDAKFGTYHFSLNNDLTFSFSVSTSPSGSASIQVTPGTLIRLSGFSSLPRQILSDDRDPHRGICVSFPALGDFYRWHTLLARTEEEISSVSIDV